MAKLIDKLEMQRNKTMKAVSFTRQEFLNKCKTKEFQFIPYKNSIGKSLSVPSRLFKDMKDKGSECIEVTSYKNQNHFRNLDVASESGFQIKFTYYLPCDCFSFVEECSVDYKSSCLKFSRSPHWGDVSEFIYEIPCNVTLYTLTSLEEWEAAIEMGYNMVKDLHDGDSTLFTYDNVFKNVCGRNNDIASNVEIGVNAKLINKTTNLITKTIELSGIDQGSVVDVTCRCEKCL